jgi:glycine betaine/proline transport system substrate-binding protein
MNRLLVTTAILINFTTAANADCGKLTIAEYDWSSGAFFAYLDKAILEKAYGCEVSMIPGSTVAVATSLREKGKPDIASEVWASTVKDLVDAAISEGTATIANPEPITGGANENWYVTPYTLEQHPELKTVQDIINNPQLFDNKIYICPVGWGCNNTTTNIMNAYNAKDLGWDLVEPGSGTALDGSIAKAAIREDNWFGFYWAPTGMLGKYGLVPVPTGTGFISDDLWSTCITTKDCPNPQITEFSKPTINTLVSKEVVANSEVFNYLSRRSIEVSELNKLIIKMDEQQETSEEAVLTFLRNREDIWTTWFDGATVAKIRSSL